MNYYNTWEIQSCGFIHQNETLEDCLYYILYLFERQTNLRVTSTCFHGNHYTIDELVILLMDMDLYHITESLHIYIRDMYLDLNCDMKVTILCSDIEDMDWIRINK